MLASIFHLFKDSIGAYLNDRAAIYAAGLAYYAVFAIAPLLVLLGSVAGVLVGQSLAAAQIVEQLQYFVGPELAGFLEEVAATVSARTFTPTGAFLSIVGLILSGAGIFSQLDTAINDIWGIAALRPQSLKDRLVLFRRRLAPFILVFFLGLLLSLTVAIDTSLSAVFSQLTAIFPWLGDIEPHVNRLIIPTLTFLTFGAIYKWLPEARSRWRDVAVGALVTTVLFLIGRWLLTLYLGRNDTPSLFGAASSLVVLLIWVDVSAHIVLFGAEFTKVYADRFGQPIVPRKLAAFTETTHLQVADATNPATEDKAASA